MADEEATTELKLLFLVWRHGDRAPIWTYPTDPHKEYEYLPYGKTHLNKAGRKRAYMLGLYLRQTYDSFLGSEWTHDLAELRSTDIPRAVETGALVMAGLFPPATDSHRWAKDGLGQLWSPIAFHVVRATEDRVLHGWKVPDPDFRADKRLAEQEALKRLLSKPEFKAAADFVAENAQVDSQDLVALSNVLDTLVAQETCGLELPAWASQVDRKALAEIRGLECGTMAYTKKQKKSMAGAFLRGVATHSQDFVAKKLPERRKLYAYSSHDYTLVGFLSALGVWDGSQPDFASVLMIELRQEVTSGAVGFKVFFRDGTDKDRQEVLLPGSVAGLCPLNKFIAQYSEYIHIDK